MPKYSFAKNFTAVPQNSAAVNTISQHPLLEFSGSYYRSYCECKLKIMHNTQPNPNGPMAQCQIQQEQRLLIQLLKPQANKQSK